MSFESPEQYASLRRAEDAAYRIATASSSDNTEDVRRHDEARINIEILIALLDIGTTLKQMMKS